MKTFPLLDNEWLVKLSILYFVEIIYILGKSNKAKIEMIGSIY